MTERQKEVFTLLRKYLEEYFCETELVERGGITFLRFMPFLFTNKTGLVCIEICLLDYTDELMIAQVYSTMIPYIEFSIDILREKLKKWNFKSLAGAYGIYEEQNQLYHKQNIVIISDAMVDDQVDFLFNGICVVMDEMARRLPEAISTVDNKIVSD